MDAGVVAGLLQLATPPISFFSSLLIAALTTTGGEINKS
jgi:hypothetical protein